VSWNNNKIEDDNGRWKENILTNQKNPPYIEMGIKYLNRYLQTHCSKAIKAISIADLSGKKIAVDISIYLYKYESENTLLESIYLLLSILRYYNVIPIFVFDGKAPTEKKNVIQQRINDRADAETEYACLKEKLYNTTREEDKREIVETMDQLKKKIVYITKHKVEQVKSLIRSYGMSYYDAHGEADELCAMLVHRKIVWACMSEDMDMFVYGCTRVIRYFSLLQHNAVMYYTTDILQELELTQKEFRQICILSGTDYNAHDGKPSASLFEIMRYFKKYKQSNTLDFYGWIKDNIREDNMDIDCPLLEKINNMFDMNYTKPWENYTDITIVNSLVNHALLEDILQKDGFIFL